MQIRLPKIRTRVYYLIEKTENGCFFTDMKGACDEMHLCEGVQIIIL